MSLSIKAGPHVTASAAPKFARARNGYEQTAVDEYIWLEAHAKQSLLNENQLLHSRLAEALKEIVALKTEIATLYDVSTSPQSVAHRISKLLRTTVDEVTQMQSDARGEAADIVAVARTEADRLIAEAKDGASQLLVEAERAAAQVTSQQISTLQQLAAVHRNLANVPAVLESAYRRRGDAQTAPVSGSVAAVSADGACGSPRNPTPDRELG